MVVNGKRQIIFRSHLNYDMNYTSDVCQLKDNFIYLGSFE